MITQDELARTAERLRDALTAAADVMAEPDAAGAVAVSAAARQPGAARSSTTWFMSDITATSARMRFSSRSPAFRAQARSAKGRCWRGRWALAITRMWGPA